MVVDNEIKQNRIDDAIVAVCREEQVRQMDMDTADELNGGSQIMGMVWRQ